jgi:hypothetical protein
MISSLIIQDFLRRNLDFYILEIKVKYKLLKLLGNLFGIPDILIKIITEN